MYTRTQGKKKWPSKSLGQTYVLVSCRGRTQLWLPAGTKTLVAAVLGSTPWHEPCWRPPFAHQDQAPLNSLHSWNLSGQPTKRGRTQSHPLVDRLCKLFLSPQLQSQQIPWIALAHRGTRPTSIHQWAVNSSCHLQPLSSVQSLSCVQLFATPWTVSCQASLSITNPGVYSNSWPLSQLCHLIISSSVIPCSSRLQSFPPSRSFQMSQFFAWGGQSIGVSASASVLPVNIQDWFSLGWTGWISLLPGTLKSLLQHHSSKASILRHSAFFIVQLSHPYMTTGKTIALTRWTFVGKVMSLLFKMLSRLVIPFLPRSKCLLILWLQSPSAVIREPPQK